MLQELLRKLAIQPTELWKLFSFRKLRIISVLLSIINTDIYI